MPGRGVRLFVIYQRRYSAAAQQALSDIRNCRLGRILLVNMSTTNTALPHLLPEGRMARHQSPLRAAVA